MYVYVDYVRSMYVCRRRYNLVSYVPKLACLLWSVLVQYVDYVPYRTVLRTVVRACCQFTMVGEVFSEKK